MTYRAYKYRIYPTEAQKRVLAGHFGAVRFVYNWGLATKKQAWEESKERISCFDLMVQLPTLKSKYEWVGLPFSQSTQSAIRHLDFAFQSFFRGAGYPRFKGKRDKQSLTFPQRVSINFDKQKIQIPKIGWIKCVAHRPLAGKLKTVTVTKTPTGKYFAACSVELSHEDPKKPAPCESQAIGVDLGIKTFAVLSNGETIANPRHLSKSLKVLRRASRRHTKKKKDSKNREKSRLRLAVIHEKVANRRFDFLQKTSTKLIRENQTICIEDLAVENMNKNPRLALHIKDAGWGMFSQMLTYKADWYGKNLLVINRFAPSSKQCSCGVKNDTLKLSQRTWTCAACGTTHNRDLLAAQNIVSFAFHPEKVVKTLIGRGTPKFTPVETLAIAGR